MSTTLASNESQAEIAQLTARARTAYEQKRTKECLALTKQVLAADADNVEANTLQSAVRSDIQRDFNDAKVLLEDARRMADGQKYRKAAEIILLKILYTDPTHEEAKVLLAAAKSATDPAAANTQTSAAAPESTPTPKVESPVALTLQVQTVPAAVAPETPRLSTPQRVDIGFTARPTPVEKKLDVRSSGMGLRVPIIAGGIVLLAGGLLLFRSYATGSAAEPAPTTVSADANLPVVPEPSAEAARTTEDERAADIVSNDNSPASAIEAAAPKLPIPAEPGSLAVSSPAPADIYMDGKFLGSTPTTLQLAAGRYTLEYRHNDLRTVMTHEIKSKETVTALVAFETTVQINARPWAQVFIEGSTRRALGQTPLSSVRVPIGSVLMFENPNFPSKTHRVAEKDSTIQVVFP